MSTPAARSSSVPAPKTALPGNDAVFVIGKLRLLDSVPLYNCATWNGFWGLF